MSPTISIDAQSSVQNATTTDQELEQGLLIALREEESGNRSELTDWLARFPHLAGQLAEFLADSKNIRSRTSSFATPSMAPESGELIAGLDLIEELDKGGEGIVYRGYDRNLKCDVAVKRLKGGTHGSDEQWSRFQKEAEVVASLEHPNIVRVNSFGVANGSPYLVMPLMKGGSFSKYLKDLGPGRRLDPKDAARFVRKIADAVHHAHQRGLIHRDLKPANILLDSHNEPHVADFGLAKRLDSGQSLSGAGAIAGTVPYMAPEQARGEKGLTTSVDVHALGSILYELLTTTPPFGKGEMMQTLKRVIEEEATPVRKFRPDVPVDLEAICMKCLEKKPSDRYGTAADLAADLNRFLNNEGVEARPPGFWDWMRQMVRARPHPNYSWQVPLWDGALLLAAGGTIYGLCQNGDSAAAVWITNLVTAAGIFIVFWWYMLRRFRSIPLTERHSLVIGVGHTLAHLALMIAVLPFSFDASAREYLVVYPAVMALSGFAVFILGSTNWSQFFPVGILVMGLTPLMTRWPDESPLIFGITMAILLWYWTIAKKLYFWRRPIEST